MGSGERVEGSGEEVVGGKRGVEVHPGVVVEEGESLVFQNLRPRRPLLHFLAPGVMSLYLASNGILSLLGYGKAPPAWVTGAVGVATGLVGWTGWRFATSEILAIVQESQGAFVRIYTVGLFSSRPRRVARIPIPLLATVLSDKGVRLLFVRPRGTPKSAIPAIGSVLTWAFSTTPALLLLRDPSHTKVPDNTLLEAISQGMIASATSKAKQTHLFWEKTKHQDGKEYWFNHLTGESAWEKPKMK